MIYLWIALGSAFGGMARYAVSGAVAAAIGETFPWGTMLVNISGSFVIGFVATLTGPDGRLLINPNIRQFMLVGICGGYTTFSSFSIQTLNLARDGDVVPAGLNIVLSVVLCLLAVWAGYVAAALLNQWKGA